MRLLKIKKLDGKIFLKTGLHIGSGEVEMHIGGTDNPIIRHPHTREPYIPGSSLKGKIRALLEMESGLVKYTEGKVISEKILEKNEITPQEKQKGEKILQIFGSGAGEGEAKKFRITRVSFSDCYLTEDWKGKDVTELKTENTIDRIKGTAQNPRTMERVVAGVKFNFSLTFKVFEGDNEDELFNYLLFGLKLLEMDALGGSGSRGYGRIEFQELKCDGREIKLPEKLWE